MKKKIICFFVCILLLVTYAGAISSPVVKVKISDRSRSDFDYSHDILGEFFTLTTCVPCKYSHIALKTLFAHKEEWDKPFYYVTMVYDKDYGNKWADQRHDELGVEASPTICWDGSFRKDMGSTESIEGDMAKYNKSIIACGNRNVKDIDLNIDVGWLGAVNPIPPDGATDWWWGDGLSFSVSTMEINVSVVNNEDSQYNGHLHGYVTEINSTLWFDKWGNPYTFAFLDYAWNDDISIDSGYACNDIIEWDGCDHNDGYGHNYSWIEQDNIMVVASVFDNDNNNYADETTGLVAGIGTDPKRFDFYFGDINPPPLVEENMSSTQWFPHDPFNWSWSTTYYWKVDVRDAKGNVKYGDIWSFTTRDNNPPYEPSDPIPPDGATNWSCGGLCWTGGDPDGDELTYDVYIGDSPESMWQIAWNQTWNCSFIEDLDFNKTYYWQIVSWEVDYNLFTVGPIWSFSTGVNLPPNPAENPIPHNGDPCVPSEGIVLKWNGSDPNMCDRLYYDLYFDDVNPPQTKQLWMSLDNFWAIEFELDEYEDYYWKVDTYDRIGEFAEGYVWSFTTGPVDLPTDPVIDGPLKGGINKEHEFTFLSIAPCNRSISYQVRWDDGTENITDFYPAGEEVTLSHTWHTYGPKIILARACDEYGLCSGWSYFQFVVTNSKIFHLKIFELFLLRYPNAFPILRQLMYFSN